MASEPMGVPTRKPTARSEARRIRRGRQSSSQQGQGHGERTYLPVTAYRRSGPLNRLAFDPVARSNRRKALAERDERALAYRHNLTQRVGAMEVRRGS